MRRLTLGLVAGLLVVSAVSTLALAQRRATSRKAQGKAATAPAPPVDRDVLKTLRPEHPRLYVLDRDLEGLKARVATNPTAKAWYAELLRSGEQTLAEPPVVHRLIGPRLLDQSRRALDRTSTLALLYRLDGDRRWFDRARKEMLAAASFPDWNPSHFLDTAEMSHALGLGYDWLYKDLSPDDRDRIRSAIVSKGLEPGLKVYGSGRGWTNAIHNWNQVCNGGMTIGALAIADERPKLAAEVVDHARRSIVKAMNTFAPDGGWPEGPGYWNYATRYNCYYLDAVSTALGTDFGLKALPGFSETDRFWANANGPAGFLFNYADGGEKSGGAAQMLWFARTFDHPWAAAREAAVTRRRGDAFHLIWSDALEKARPDPSMPTDALYRGIDVAFFRSAWDDPKAVFIGFKGGDNKANHSHLDLGSFVLDADGHRWATDLGGDDYNLPGYFGKNRWDYFRLNTQSHNTILIDGKDQDPKARAPVVAYRSTPARAYAVADLTAAYAPAVRSARRGIALIDRRRVLVQDEVTAARPAQIRWQMLTRAKVDLSGEKAVLTQQGSTLTARLLEPKGGRFEVVGASPPPPQRQNPGASLLTVKVEAPDRPVRIVVLLELGPGDAAPPAVGPLERWIAEGAVARGR